MQCHYRAGLLFASFLIITAITAARGATARLSVLPFQADGVPTGLVTALEGEFIAQLQETGAFEVIPARERDRILQEQAFQQTGAVDAAYAVAVGKLVGATQLAAVTVTATGKTEFAVAARLVDVASGMVAIQFAEKRSGDTYAACTRMLKNAAWCLAGDDTQDHEEYLAQQELNSADGMKQSRIAGMKHRLVLNGNLNYSFDLFQHDNYEAIRKAFDADPNLVTSTYPEKKTELGTDMGYGLRLSERLWIVTDLSYKNSAEFTRTAVLQRQFAASYRDIPGNPLSDTVDLAGPMNTRSTNSVEYSHFSIGAGIRYDAVTNPRMILSIDLMPAVGRVSYVTSSYDSSYADIAMDTNGTYLGQMTSDDIWKYETKMSSELIGFRTGVHMDFLPHGNMFISVSAVFAIMFAPSLEGTRTVTEINRSNSIGTVSSNDTTYTENVALVKGDFLETGTYYREEDPDDKFYINGEPVPIRKTYREFHDFQLKLGIGFFF